MTDRQPLIMHERLALDAGIPREVVEAAKVSPQPLPYGWRRFVNGRFETFMITQPLRKI